MTGAPQQPMDLSDGVAEGTGEGYPPEEGVSSQAPHGGEFFTVDAIIGLTNVLFFIVVQSLFWWYFGSREVDRVIQQKASIVRDLRDELVERGLDECVLVLDATVVGAGRRAAEGAERGREERDGVNLRHTCRWMIPIAAAVIGIILLLVLYNRRRTKGGQERKFEYAHWVGLGLVLFVYVFEILFFLFVVEEHIMIGDYELAREVTGLR